MKECQAPGLIGKICRQNEGCFMKFHAEAESEKDTLPSIRQELEKLDGCQCQRELIDHIDRRIFNQESVLELTDCVG